jgi:formylglycine-generating enzyme required for sulfatase activity
LTWGTVAGWTAPSPSAATQMMAEGGTLTFTGTYALNGGVPAGFVSVPAGTFTMGSPADEPERNPRRNPTSGDIDPRPLRSGHRGDEPAVP